MKSRGYLWILLMFSASLSKSLLRLFGETLSFETPASTQATICPLQGMVRKAWRGWKQEDLSYVTSLVVVASSKFMVPSSGA